MNDTVSVRIPREIKEKLREYNINVSEVIRTCLHDTVRREENLRRLKEVDQELQLTRRSTPRGTAAGLIREDRDLEH
jgi:post-segregation antitoxin (ccd killing protein)